MQHLYENIYTHTHTQKNINASEVIVRKIKYYMISLFRLFSLFFLPPLDECTYTYICILSMRIFQISFLLCENSCMLFDLISFYILSLYLSLIYHPTFITYLLYSSSLINWNYCYYYYHYHRHFYYDLTIIYRRHH